MQLSENGFQKGKSTRGQYIHIMKLADIGGNTSVSANPTKATKVFNKIN
jgi:hypothetical protein